MQHRTQRATRYACSRRFVLPIAGTALALGCTTTGFDLQDDSFAHVSVVDNSVDDPGLLTFSLAAKPTVHTGARNDSKLEQELWNVVDAVMTSDHSLIVSMSSGKEVRQFDSTSAFVRTIGRRGDGPGEFKQAARLVVAPGDSLRLFDHVSGAITTFNKQGAVVDVTMIGDPRSHSFLGAICCFDDGAYLAVTRSQRKGRKNWYGKRSMMDLHFVDAGRNFAVAKRMLEVEDDDASIVVPDMPVIYASGLPSNKTARQGTRAPFARSATVNIVGDQIIYGIGDAFEYLVFSKNGDAVRRVRASFEPVAVTTAIWNAERESSASRWNNKDVYLAVGRTIDRISQRPPSLPAYAAILGDEDGRVWVRRSSGDPNGEELWACFDQSGILIGKLILPAAYTVVRFSSGHAVIRHKDDKNGFASISAFKVVKGG